MEVVLMFLILSAGVATLLAQEKLVMSDHWLRVR